MRAEYWLDRAVSEIRFAPDQRAVRAELAAHLEDRRECLEAQGLSACEAEEAATEAMGDPAELAEELARVHTPYWGWLWRTSQFLLAAIALWAAVTLLPQMYTDWKYTRGLSWGREAGVIRELSEPGSAMTYACGAERTVLEVWCPKGSVKAGNYRFSVPYVWLERWDSPPDSAEDWEYFQLVVYIRTSTWRFWEPCLYNVFFQRPVTESTGQEYFAASHGVGFDGSLTTYYDIYSYDDPAFYGDITPYGMWDSFFPRWYRFGFCQESPEAVPDWVDIPLGDNDGSIRIDLRNEVVS